MFTRNKQNPDDKAEADQAADANDSKERSSSKAASQDNGTHKSKKARKDVEEVNTATDDADIDTDDDAAVKERIELPATEGADGIVRNHMYLAAGLGIIPIPAVDFVTTSLVTLNMLRRLSNYYGIPFSRKLAKTAVASLASGAATPLVALSVSSLVKSIPIVGSAIGAVTSPLAAGAFTYATGQVFILHFGSGGTLFNFDPEKFRDYFQTQIKEGEAMQAQAVSTASNANTTEHATR